MELPDEQFVNEIAPVHMLHPLIKMAEDHLVHAAELLDLLAAVGVRGQQRHLTTHDDRVRMHVEREHGARAADLLRALDRLLHERTMTQMHAVKISERDRTGFCNFYHRAIP